MSLGVNGHASIGNVTVYTTNDGGHSPEFWAKRATDMLCDISKDAEPHVRQQAEAFKNRIYELILRYITEAIRSDRSTLCSKLEKEGLKSVADAIKGM